MRQTVLAEQWDLSISDVFSLISLVALLHAANTNSSAIYSQW